ncbi:MAG: GntR family transcriptional regulator [Alphaproteobacteria bacterium]|nr:GntR family transcriptional regulator [Alphaproteobacteria bacterium]HPF45547.1 GntR family transcriptional regulator [Emcibacteraceae bacterium]HRW29118.1 GntR family transcriptional regulator [Emcibacteraceae bacterium]
MELTIDTESDIPLFSQLVDQIKGAVQVGVLAPDDPLPSIRQLANDLDLNNKTVAKAYRMLERDKIVKTKGYRGTYIHSDARNNCTKDLNNLIFTELSKVIEKLKGTGATDSEIRIAFADVMNNRTQG